MSDPIIERLLWFLSIVLGLSLGTRLLVLRVVRNYRFFISILFFDGVRGVVGWFSSPESRAYHNLWRATEPVMWALFVLTVLELCTAALKEYRGIQSLGRWVICASLALSVFLSLITVAPTWMRSSEAVFAVSRYLMVERGIDFALVLLLLLLLAFLTLFPIRLSKNLIVHCIVYAIYFVSNTIGILVVNVTGRQISFAVSTTLMGVSDLCLVAWLALMNREGEQKIVPFRPPIPAVDEGRLIEQLANINATLLRTGKRV